MIHYVKFKLMAPDFGVFVKKFSAQLASADEIEIKHDTNLKDIAGWDSLTAMAVNSMIDFEYGINIEIDEFERFSSVGEIFDFVTKNK